MTPEQEVRAQQQLHSAKIQKAISELNALLDEASKLEIEAEVAVKECAIFNRGIPTFFLSARCRVTI